MTEEQKKKCEEIYNLHIDFPLKIRPIFLPKFGWVKIAMLLAEVFNKNITEEEAGEIFDNIFNDINKNGMNCVKAKAILLPIGINPISQSNYKDTFWKIANYFDNGNKEANKINNVVENTAKEKIMPNNDELTLNLLILGQTGVGKSSLINALVGKKLFKTADDKEKEEKVKPTTPAGIFRQTVEIDGKKVNVYDSWGIERDDKSAKEWKELIKNELKKRGVDKDIKDWFHSVTFCISAGKNGIEYIETDIIKELLDAKYNVVIALSQADYMISNTKGENDKFIDEIPRTCDFNGFGVFE